MFDVDLSLFDSLSDFFQVFVFFGAGFGFGFYVIKTFFECAVDIVIAILDLFKWLYDKAKSRKHPKN